MTLRWRALSTALLLAAALLPAAPSRAQVDPEKRRLLQFGWDHPFSPGPSGAYFFYYMNEPRFVRKDLTMRLVLAPVYLDSMLGWKALGSEFGFGLEGGGFADSYSEVRHGHYFRDESFSGDGAAVNAVFRQDVNPGQRVPLGVEAHARVHGAFFRRNSSTAADFTLPPNFVEYKLRFGARLGGVPPRLMPARALELSFWYEPILRSRSRDYGLNGDRTLGRFSQLYWSRLRMDYRLSSGRRFGASIQAGDSINADRLDAYRIGGFLPFSSEFPLQLPGYFNGELTAEHYVLLRGDYSGFFDGKRRWLWRASAASANVNFLRGMDQPKPWNSGVAVGAGYESPGGVLLVNLDYGYGIDAMRGGHRGGHSVSLMVQVDLQAWRTRGPTQPGIRPSPQKFQGLQWLQNLFSP